MIWIARGILDNRDWRSGHAPHTAAESNYCNKRPLN